MTPTIGRIIHVIFSDEPELPCRAAIVTGVNYGASTPRQIFVSAFSHRGDNYRAVVTDDANWHDPRECTQQN